MSKMQTKKNGPGDKVKKKKHTIIDKNCVEKVIQNHKVLSSVQLTKAQCSIRRKEIDTEIDKSTGNQTYKYTGDKPRGTGTLSDTHMKRLRQNYHNAKQVGPKAAKNYLNTLPNAAKNQLKSKYGIN
jgi:hypothetical protein